MTPIPPPPKPPQSQVQASGRKWLLLAGAALLLLAASGGALLWQLSRIPADAGMGKSDAAAHTSPTEPPPSPCSDDDDPKLLEPLEFGQPLTARFERRLLDGLARTPLPAVEVYPWQPDHLVAILGEHRMRGSLFTVSPDSQTLAVASGGVVHIGPVGTLHEKQRLSCPAGVAALAWSPVGDRLAVSVHSRALLLFDLRNPASIPEPGVLEQPSATVTTLSWSADGKYLLGGDSNPDLGTAHLWDMRSGKIVNRLRHAGVVTGVAFSPVVGDYRVVTAGGPKDGALHLWDALGSKEERAIIDFRREPMKSDASTGVGAVAFSPSGKQILSCHPDGAVRLWNIDRFAQGKEIHTLSGHAPLPLACFTPDGKGVVTTQFADGGVWLWDLAQGKRIRQLGSALVTAIRFLGDDQLAYCGNRSSDANVHLYQVKTGKEILSPIGHLNALTGVATSPDGQTIASVGHDQTMRLWVLTEAADQRAAAQERHTIGASSPVGVGFLADGKKTYCYGGHPPVILARGVDGKSITPAFREGHSGSVVSCDITRDGRYALTGGLDGRVVMWRLQDGAKVRVFLHEGPAVVAIAPDMRRAVRAGGAKTRLLHLRCQSALCEWPPVSQAPFLPDGRAVLLGGSDCPTWKITAEAVEKGPVLPCNLSGLTQARISANGASVAGLRNGWVVVRDLRTGKQRWAWTPPPALGGVLGVALSADGGHLLTANGDGTAYVIQLP